MEKLAYGDVTILLKDGALNELERALLPREKVLSSLRSRGIVQLGELRRAYLESNGRLSVLRFKTAVPGLPLLPDMDGLQLRELPGQAACAVCGCTAKPGSQSCRGCGACEWVHAAIAAA